jgi:hypothetical protein
MNRSEQMAPVEAHFTGATICMEKDEARYTHFGIAPPGVGLAAHPYQRFPRGIPF